MNVSRRRFLMAGAALGATSLAAYPVHARRLLQPVESQSTSGRFVPSTFSVTPVVGDGKFILSDPPENTIGYFDPRDFEVRIGMSFTGTADSTELTATTVAPVSFPEQEIIDFAIEKQGCDADIIPLGDSAAQFALAAGTLAKNQTVHAVAKYHLRVSMNYPGFTREMFPEDQGRVTRTFDRGFLTSSVGIKCNVREVKDIVAGIVSSGTHPWDAAREFQTWVWDNIAGVPGDYTSVEEAINNRKGDCEERAAVFIALCRAAGIPARLVWVPGHNWAEIGLIDNDGNAHWIPVHTAAYSWFGWTGVHEIVMQKGDNVQAWQRRRKLRLIDDWYRIKGPKPEMVYTATVRPLPSEEGADPGPGEREKTPDGVWELTGTHAANAYIRDK